MSKLLDNKQIIHIVSEIFVIAGITIYFSSQNKKLLNHINDLTQRIDDQEEVIQTHEKKIAQLVSLVENSTNNFPKTTTQIPSNIRENMTNKSVGTKPVENKTVETKNSNIKNIPKKPSSMNIKPVGSFDNFDNLNNFNNICY